MFFSSKPTQPQNVRITNVTNDTFTVSYETSDSVFGVLSYGESQSLGKSGLDDRDQETGNVTNHKAHNITIRNLSPDKKYYFSIISGKDTYLNNDLPYEITTGSEISDVPSSQEPISGKIILPDGKAPIEAIIYATIEGSQVISTLVKNDGTFIIPLNSLRNSDFSAFFEFNPEQVVKLLIEGDGLQSNVTLSLSQVAPVPIVTLSNDYNFIDSLEKIATSSADLKTFPSFSSNQTSGPSTAAPKILTPKQDQNLSDQQPEFTGTAKPNETVEIEIHSDEQIKTTVKANSQGNWTYKPSKDLSPGNHTITIKTKDSNGILKTITRSFVVYASGSQIPGENGSPTPTPKNPSPTTKVSPSVTVAPTEVIASETLTPTQGPTKGGLVTPTATTTLAPTPPLPPTGNASIITFGMIGLAITLFGSAFFLLSRGGKL
jgi:hypothetical protein